MDEDNQSTSSETSTKSSSKRESKIKLSLGSIKGHAKLPGYDGFEELRKFVKQGSEFSKEISVILQERSDAETAYAKSLSKVATKLIRACSNGIGSLTEGWKSVGVAMEQEAELHKNLAAGLFEDISKPLKSFIDVQIRARKPLEAMVDKSYKNLLDKRADEFRSKKASYSCCRDYEKAESALSDARTGKAKDISKMEKKSKHSLTLLKKADKDYTEAAYLAESARQDWDMTVARASTSMQDLEEERLKTMQDNLNKYNSHVSVLPPKLTQYFNTLNEAIISVDLQQDVQTIVTQRGMKTPRQPEQLLLESYAEDGQMSMDNERRKEALKNYLIHLQQYIEKERKGKEGVQKLIEVYRNKPSFANPETQEDTRQKLEQTTFMLNFLEASHFKINGYLCKMEGKSSPSNMFQDYIETVRDRQSYLVSTLRLPLSIALEGNNENLFFQTPMDDHYSEVNLPDDEFINDEFPSPTVIGYCQALYDYEANQNDELTMRAGDNISIFEKLGDGWWEGELHGIRGIFPSTYVQEI
ncbi:nostrin-like isoform x4 [Plakobranchus ocellatus]|uniref:Nostrin-like isoform x4 n=1 Tax=Plakobranchus ocellatus TaxID=259542 RepID=A0AAV4C5L2_9GAST|nr:nostrin-like isoform x4 [Plakobranchus ocellatus]